MIAAEATVPQVATEITDIPQVAMMQSIGFPEAHDAWEWVLIMLEHAQQIID
jgi:hypothetical protein